jgi:ABC-2 type transport system permease protein
MTLLFTSIFSGISVIWDREFGFLKEILVAPVSRLSIVIGRSLGGATTAVFQGMIVLCLFMLISLKVNILSILTVIPVMLMISLGFVTLGITIASLLENVEGFQLIMNFIVQPMFFLSGAFFPLQNLPQWLRGVTFLDPMTYGVETMRYVLIGFSSMPIYTSLGVVLLFAGITSIIGSYTFSRRQ